MYSVTLGDTGRYADAPPAGWQSFVKEVLTNPLEVLNVQAKGKFIYLTLSKDWAIWNTLGMSGTWSMSPDKHESLTLHSKRLVGDTDCTTHLTFVDARHFGTVKFVKGQKPTEDKLNSLGFDPFDGLPPINIFNALQLKKWADKPIAQVMMDQSLFCGVGNYIRAEALYAAKMNPWRLAKQLSLIEVTQLTSAITTIMWNSYNSNGATISTYRDAEGTAGSFASKFAVYGRKTDSLGHLVVREDTPDKRTIHWCPICQQ